MFYIVLAFSLEQTYCTHVACDIEWVNVTFYFMFLNMCQSVLTVLFGCNMAGAMWNWCHLGACFVYTMQPCTSLQCQFIRSLLPRVHVCLAATCHPHISRMTDLLCATALTWGWNRYWNNKSAQNIDPGEETSPAVQCLALYHWAIHDPRWYRSGWNNQ